MRGFSNCDKVRGIHGHNRALPTPRGSRTSPKSAVRKFPAFAGRLRLIVTLRLAAQPWPLKISRKLGAPEGVLAAREEHTPATVDS